MDRPPLAPQVSGPNGSPLQFSAQRAPSVPAQLSTRPPRMSADALLMTGSDAAADARAALAAIAAGEPTPISNDAWSFERRRESADALLMCQENVNW